MNKDLTALDNSRAGGVGVGVWNQLQSRKEMIAKGWAKIGLDAIFKPERQAAALLSMATKGMSMDDAPEGEEESESHEDAWKRQAERRNAMMINTVKEQEEEEVDMDVSIAACLEDNRLFKECGVAVNWQNE